MTPVRPLNKAFGAVRRFPPSFRRDRLVTWASAVSLLFALVHLAGIRWFAAAIEKPLRLIWNRL